MKKTMMRSVTMQMDVLEVLERMTINELLMVGMECAAIIDRRKSMKDVELKEMCLSGDWLGAIKILRDRDGTSLLEAKAIVDGWRETPGFLK